MTREDLHKAIDQLYRPDIRRAVCLGAYAGLRISEAAALRWSDVDLENRQLRIMNSKGNKSRRIPMSPTLLDALLPNTGGNVVSGGEAYSTYRLARRVRSAFRPSASTRRSTSSGTDMPQSLMRQAGTY